MTAAKKPSLDPDLAPCPEPEQHWFVLPEGLRVALVGFKAADVRPGTSRDRKKAGVHLVLLIAATGVVTEEVLDALAAAQDLKPRDLKPREGKDVTWLNQQEPVWIEEDRPVTEYSVLAGFDVGLGIWSSHRERVRTRLGDEEATALRVIADVAAHGPRLANKLAVFDLMRWFGQHGRQPTALAVNALAAVVEYTGAANTLDVVATANAEAMNDGADEAFVALAKRVGWQTLSRLAGEGGKPSSPAQWVALARRDLAKLLEQTGAPALIPLRLAPDEHAVTRSVVFKKLKDERYDGAENVHLQRLGENVGERLALLSADAFAAQRVGSPVQRKARARLLARTRSTPESHPLPPRRVSPALRRVAEAVLADLEADVREEAIRLLAETAPVASLSKPGRATPRPARR